MSGDNMWCSKCKSHHHAVEDCDGGEVKLDEGVRKEAKECAENLINDLVSEGIDFNFAEARCVRLGFEQALHSMREKTAGECAEIAEAQPTLMRCANELIAQAIRHRFGIEGKE